MKKLLIGFALLLMAGSASGQVKMIDTNPARIERGAPKIDPCESYYSLMLEELNPAPETDPPFQLKDKNGRLMFLDGHPAMAQIGENLGSLSRGAQYATIYMACKEHGK